MKFIAHRGNTDGRTILENHPSYIEFALWQGFEAEVDVWVYKNCLWLGHDTPMHKIEEQFLIERRKLLWCHAKNVEALQKLSLMEMNAFGHSSDPFVVTTKGDIIMHNNSTWKPGVIVMCPEKTGECNGIKRVAGLCSDYVSKYKERYDKEL